MAKTDRLLTTTEAGKRLGVGRHAIRNRIINGECPGVLCGRCWKVPASALDTWLAHKAAEALQATMAANQ